jgi:hypothetical protein
MLTNVGRGLSPPSGNTKCQPTGPFPLQSLLAFFVLSLPGIVVVGAACAARGMLASTAAAPPIMKARAPATNIEPASNRHLPFIQMTSCG